MMALAGYRERILGDGKLTDISVTSVSAVTRLQHERPENRGFILARVRIYLLCTAV
jgi:hypothetical protein